MRLRPALRTAGLQSIALATIAFMLAGGQQSVAGPRPEGAEQGTGWAFTADSFWNERHDDTSEFPTDPNSDVYVANLKDSVPSNRRYVELAGTDNDAWGTPYYKATPATRVVTVTCELSDRDRCYGFYIPQSGKPTIDLRLPSSAEPSDSVDSEMVLVDRTPGTNHVVWMWQACPPAPFRNDLCSARYNHWTANGLSVHSMDSDGLDGCWESSYPRDFVHGDRANRGHRGFPGAYVAVLYNEVAVAGSIPHVLKLNIPNTGSNHWFPYTGDEDNGTNDKIPEGVLFRIKPRIDLSRYGLSPSALVLARALQRYGAVVGDTSGSTVNVTVENLYVSGSPERWSDAGISPRSLSDIPLGDYEFVRRGAGGPSPDADPCARDPL